MQRWFNAVGRLGLKRGASFDLDFHTIPFHGEDALLEKHYVSRRSRRQKGILAFLAQDAETRVFCYANLHELERLGIHFITLRRRSRKLLQEIAATPASAWRRIELEGVSRLYKTPRILDREITLPGYQGPIRQLTILDLGHEEPTLLLTNERSRSPAKLIGRYAQRMLIENNIADGIDFFHMDALSSAVAMKVNCDLQLTLMASSLYRLLATRIGQGYETVKSRHLFRDFIHATAMIAVAEKEILVTFQKRAHNPLLVAAEFHKTDLAIPWLGRKHLRFVFG